jgi:histidinol-phosphate aminotransferase
MDYLRPASSRGALRLHLNENTAGCSPKVLEAIRSLDAEQMAVYPDYGDATADCARLLGVDASWLALTNGLDEGIWAAAAASVRGGADAGSAIVPEPAFDMYAACVSAAGGVVTTVAPGPNLAFPLDAVVGAVRQDTRLVFLCSPNNPSGAALPPSAVSRVASAVPGGALVFLDEAYADFASGTFLPFLSDHTNVIVGRTFAKAYGLAALRIGCIVARPETLARLQRVIPPYNLNVCAVEGLRAAIRDQEYTRWYCGQVAESRERVYEACRRLGFRYWPSEANFVLVRVGDRCGDIVAAMAARGVLVRDRSGEPGCGGCLRITTGVVEHTARCLAVLEEVL